MRKAESQTCMLFLSEAWIAQSTESSSSEVSVSELLIIIALAVGDRPRLSSEYHACALSQ